MPSKFLRMISKYQDNPGGFGKQAGIAYAVDQIIDLLSNDIDGIHLYTTQQARNRTERIGRSSE